MPQTSVSLTMGTLIQGNLFDTGPHDIGSYVNEGTAEIPFGVMVKQGTGDKGALPLAATSDKLIGVVVRSDVYDKPNELGDTGLKQYVQMNILKRGRIVVPVEEAVTPASSVYVRAVVAGSEVAGAFRDTTDASDLIDISKFARYLTTTTGAGLVVVEIDMTNRAA